MSNSHFETLIMYRDGTHMSREEQHALVYFSQGTSIIDNRKTTPLNQKKRNIEGHFIQMRMI